jgi:DNA-directed RNA polymerase specialized sigma24 family protein
MNRNKLKQYKNIFIEIKELEEEIEDLEKGLSRRGERVRCTSAPKDFTGDTASLILDLKMLLAEKIEILTVMRREIENCFLTLSSQERRLMRKKYILGKTNQVIANEMFMSIDNVKRIHSLVLKKIERDCA